MSRRPNAPYVDVLSEDESTLVYQGHDSRRTPGAPDPKAVNQPRHEPDGKPTRNGLFAGWIDESKAGRAEHAIFRVYEKMLAGVWTDRGLYLLKDYAYKTSGSRDVFKFWLEQTNLDSTPAREDTTQELRISRQIPSRVKQAVYKRDKGRCVICGATDQLHFDHDFPFSRGGTSVLPENVRVLCARHNLQKASRIE